MANVDHNNRGAGISWMRRPLQVVHASSVEVEGAKPDKRSALLPPPKIAGPLSTGLLTGLLAGALTGRINLPSPDHKIALPDKHVKRAIFANFRS